MQSLAVLKNITLISLCCILGLSLAGCVNTAAIVSPANFIVSNVRTIENDTAFMLSDNTINSTAWQWTIESPGENVRLMGKNQNLTFPPNTVLKVTLKATTINDTYTITKTITVQEGRVI